MLKTVVVTTRKVLDILFIYQR